VKLTTTTNVSVDGVMQGLGGQDEDRRGGLAAAACKRAEEPHFDNHFAAVAVAKRFPTEEER